MSARLGVWLLGFASAVIAASAVPEDLFPAVRVILASTFFVTVGVAGDFFLARKNRHVSKPLADVREADGVVEVGTTQAVRREPNRDDERFGRFLGLETEETECLTHGVAGNSRSSPPLLGRIVIVSLFLGRDGRPWSEREIADAHDQIFRAGEWIEREAGRYRARVNVEISDTYFVYDDDRPEDVAIAFQGEGEEVGPIEQRAGLKALIRMSNAAVALGFLDAADLFEKIGARHRVDHVVWLTHPRQAGRSFALSREDTEWDGVSLAVCYPREASFPERLNGPARVDPVTVVHELLHLFGASDKYSRSLGAFSPKTVTNREVMRLDETRLRRLRIDSATAGELGWSVRTR